MTRVLLDGEYRGVELVHVPTRFSGSLNEMGKPRPKKLIELVSLVRRVARVQRRLRPEVLYYVPAPPALAPVIRDLILLNLVRRHFRFTIFHFHAGGVSGYRERLYPWLRPAFDRAYRRPDAAVLTSRGAPDDATALDAVSTWVVHNGIPDPPPARSTGAASGGLPRILYLGLVSQEKGIFTLLEACRRLRAEGVDFALDIAGPFADSRVEQETAHVARSGPLSDTVEVHGAIEGPAKWPLFRSASVFCFPSAHPSETFGITMIEALACGLPVIAANRRGAPEIVAHGVTGLLFEPGDAADLASCLARLLASPELCASMGVRARLRYEQAFTEDRFRAAMQQVFDTLSKEQSRQRAEVAGGEAW